ncbi:hypothetical protein LOTGIDRAFT_118950 [Lottia gigantea]|uniref:Endonuclease/exonuclease/phosphatase domain-containing protein n=1 Tax=Lottia gigantea TaxID=225164 RepID=V4AEJ7_LOTGI|nr:hypothetical protein LOTGIDRAFT_118950 [Lottia gigantea]ESO93565.1 hypothetical protein LOTGIDRAFT_118950 [Lottia gigantea]
MRYERDGPKTGKPGLPFSIMSYNVLSQNLLENHMYLYKSCPPEALDWDMRSEKLLTEIKLYSPDIICLQEVQSDHYESFFKNKLFKLGYGSEYIKRSGDKPDGCATFYKQTKFTLVQSTPIEFYKGDILDRDNVALILELSPNTKLYHGSVRKIGIANTHLLYNPKRGDIKLAQLMVLLAELDKILLRNSTEKKPSYFPLLLCGDFNSEPHGDLYKFLTTGFLNYEGRLARNLSGQYEGTRGRNYQMKKHFFSSSFGITDQCQYVQNVVERQESQTQTSEKQIHENSKTLRHFSQSSGRLWHNFNLISAYNHRIQRLGFREYEVTSQHAHEACCVDYIFYSGSRGNSQGHSSYREGKLKLLARYGLMSSQELYRMGGLPNKVHPSDHMCLISKFLLR